MPVWHELTKPWRESGELVMVGITQEQHPERCQLFAQWKEFDWPILWDPFNLTGSMLVPIAVAVDEHGVVRKVRPSQTDFEASFLAVDYPAPEGTLPPSAPLEDRLVELSGLPRDDGRRPWLRALGDLLWRRLEDPTDAILAIESASWESPEDGKLAFRAGVARRMLYDSARTSPEDFQASLDHWARALDLEPNQYIWRRRIQQYGPRQDKPYPFYDWVEQARSSVRERGLVPVELGMPLTPAELARPRSEFTDPVAVEEPDPDGKIDRDEGLIEIESAVAFAPGPSSLATVHLTFRPDARDQAHWNNEVEPLVLWIDAASLPEGWRVESSWIETKMPSAALSEELRSTSFDLQLAGDARQGSVRGYALYYVCEGESGTCLYLRQDFEVPVAARR